MHFATPDYASPVDQLVWAAGAGDIEKVRALLATGADPNGRSVIGGWTALMRAATDAIAAELLAAGADPLVTDEIGMDVLAHALDAANREVALRLLQAGADIDARNQYEWTRLRTAAFMRNPAAIELLLALGASPALDRGKLLSAASWYSSKGYAPDTERTIELLIAAGEDVDAADMHGYTALHCAVSDYAHTPSDEEWWNASSDGSDETATRTLLKHGANPNIAGSDSMTPLLLAAGSSSWADVCIEALIDAGADPDQPTSAGTTPLMRAASLGRVENLKVLLARGADAHRKDRYGQHALHYARVRLAGIREEAAAAETQADGSTSLRDYLHQGEVDVRACITLLEAITGS